MHPVTENQETVMKTILKLVVALVVILVIAAAVVVFQIDAIAKTAVEKGGTYALGVDTTVDSVSIGLLSGTLGMKGFAIGNAPGYPAEKMLDTGTFDFAVDTSTVRSDHVMIDKIALETMTLRLEKKDGKYNAQVIADNIKRRAGGEGEGDPTEPEPAPAPDKPARKFTVKQFTVTDITVYVDGVPGSPFTVKKVSLPNVGSDVTMDELIARLYPALMGSVLKSIGALPAELVNTLTRDLAGAAQALGGEAAALLEGGMADATRMLEDVGGEAVRNVTEGAGDAVKNVTDGLGKDAEDAVKKATDGLGGLFGGDKNKD